jgi:putative membrane protein
MAMMWGDGFGWFGWLMMTAWWVLVVVGVVWLVRAASAPRDSDAGGARRVLDERFATGELSVEEYEQRRRALR